MDGVNIIAARIGDPAVFLANGLQVSGIESVNVVMRIDIAQFESMPQRVHPSGKIGLIGRVHISSIQVNHRAVFRIGFLSVPGHGKTIPRTIGLIDPLPVLIIAVGVVNDVTFHRHCRRETPVLPGDHRAHVSHVFIIG